MNATSPARPARATGLGLGLAALTIALDQATKWWILAVVMQPPRVIEITSFFSLVMAWNKGVSFGMFHDGGAMARWLLPLLAVAITAALLVWLWRVDDRLTGAALGLIIGGALGNLIDRVVHDGAVADFLLFHYAGWAWPAFNLADSAITVGAIALVVESLFGRAERNKN